MTRNLVVGGAGFLGGYLVAELTNRGEDVVVLDIAATGPRGGDEADAPRLVKGTTADWRLLLSVLSEERFDCVFHVGALVPPASEEDLLGTYQSTVVGTVNVLEAAHLCGVTRVVYAGSQAVFGSELPTTIDEALSRRPWTMYGACKACEEVLGLQYRRRHGLDFRGVILPPIVGPGRTKYGLSGFSGWTAGGFAGLVLDCVAAGEPYVFNVSEQTTIPSAVYVRDAARSFIMLRDADDERLSRRMYVVHGLGINMGAMCVAIRGLRPDARLSFAPDRRVMDLVATWPRLDDAAAKRDWGWFAEYDNEDVVVTDFLETLLERPELRVGPGREG